MSNVFDKNCRYNQNNSFVLNTFFQKKVRFEVKLKNFVEPGRSQSTKWLMRFACWIHKATNIEEFLTTPTDLCSQTRDVVASHGTSE
jgi:hypothetical protein